VHAGSGSSALSSCEGGQKKVGFGTGFVRGAAAVHRSGLAALIVLAALTRMSVLQGAI
jgi:hypothetical protein